MVHRQLVVRRVHGEIRPVKHSGQRHRQLRFDEPATEALVGPQPERRLAVDVEPVRLGKELGADMRHRRGNHDAICNS